KDGKGECVVSVCVCLSVCVIKMEKLSVWVCVCGCVGVWVCACVCVCVCVCGWVFWVGKSGYQLNLPSSYVTSNGICRSADGNPACSCVCGHHQPPGLPSRSCFPLLSLSCLSFFSFSFSFFSF